MSYHNTYNHGNYSDQQYTRMYGQQYHQDSLHHQDDQYGAGSANYGDQYQHDMYSNQQQHYGQAVDGYQDQDYGNPGDGYDYEQDYDSKHHADDIIKPFNPDLDPYSNTRIIVAVRKRPMNSKETSKRDQDIIRVQDSTVSVIERKKTFDLKNVTTSHPFKVDQAYSEQATNEEIYHQLVQPLVHFTLAGNRSTCFAYGQTGSGKTFTMMGHKSGVHGLYALAVYEIFQIIPPEIEFYVSFFEIYGGKLYDLCNRRKQLVAREDEKKRVNIVGLREIEVRSENALLSLIDRGNSLRSSGTTGMNDESSRSHAVLQFIFRLKSETERAKQREKEEPSGPVFVQELPYAKLSFIDLAGSERGADTSQNTAKTRQEGADINKSLLALKECIRAIEISSSHTPFRGSVLTQVLKDSLTGPNTRTAMIATVAPNNASCEHTINTLRYAIRVKEGTGPGGANSNPSAAPSRTGISGVRRPPPPSNRGAAPNRQQPPRPSINPAAARQPQPHRGTAPPYGGPQHQQQQPPPQSHQQQQYPMQPPNLQHQSSRSHGMPLTNHMPPQQSYPQQPQQTGPGLPPLPMPVSTPSASNKRMSMNPMGGTGVGGHMHPIPPQALPASRHSIIPPRSPSHNNIRGRMNAVGVPNPQLSNFDLDSPPSFNDAPYQQQQQQQHGKPKPQQQQQRQYEPQKQQPISSLHLRAHGEYIDDDEGLYDDDTAHDDENGNFARGDHTIPYSKRPSAQLQKPGQKPQYSPFYNEDAHQQLQQPQQQPPPQLSVNQQTWETEQAMRSMTITPRGGSSSSSNTSNSSSNQSDTQQRNQPQPHRQQPTQQERKPSPVETSSTPSSASQQQQSEGGRPLSASSTPAHRPAKLPEIAVSDRNLRHELELGQIYLQQRCDSGEIGSCGRCLSDSPCICASLVKRQRWFLESFLTLAKRQMELTRAFESYALETVEYAQQSKEILDEILHYSYSMQDRLEEAIAGNVQMGQTVDDDDPDHDGAADDDYNAHYTYHDDMNDQQY